MGIERINKLIAFSVSFFIILALVVFSSQFTDNTQSDFDSGTYNNTTYNGSAIVLSGNNISGTYTSQVFDAGSASWNNISWTNNNLGELSNNTKDNALLLHMNEQSGTIVDYSGKGNDGTYNGALYSQSGKLNTAIGFDGFDDYIIRAYDGDFNFGTGSFSIIGWFKNQGNTTTITVSSRISQSSDDAEETVLSGSMDLTSTDLELIEDSSVDQEVGMRFQNINIPLGAVIINAYIQFTVDETDSGSTNLTFYAEDIDNAPVFSSSNGDITSRTKTNASVDWANVPAWNSVGASGSDQQTPDISAIIQEVVNRSGWLSGNSIVVVVDGVGERTAESFNGDSANAPLLVVEYRSSQYLASRYDSDQGFKVWIRQDGKVAFGVDDDDIWNPDVVTTSLTAYNNNTWYHFAAIKENSTSINLYIDGVLVASNSSIGALQSNVSSRISQSSDDAEETVLSGSMDLTSTDLELIEDSSVDQEVGMRFQNINIPLGAVIINAYIQFTVDETDSGSTNLTFYAEDIDNAPVFSSSNGDITSRTKTNASVDWANVPAWNSVGASGSDQQTPDISAIIQEVVNRSGWLSGNSIVVVVDGVGERTAESFNGDSANAPLLVVEYNSSLGTLSSNSAPLVIGANGNLSDGFFNGTIDEFAIYNNSLSAEEILEHYKRGILRLNLTVRSCDDVNCDSENFIDINDNSLQDLNVSNNTYFQYKFNFETDDSPYSPELYNLTIGYTSLNQLPIVSSFSLTPSSPATNNDLTCTFTTTDGDVNDSLTANITWYKNNAVYSSLTQSITNGTQASSILDSSNTLKNEEWNCTVFPNDGTVNGDQNSSSLTIQNTLPSIPAIPNKSTDSSVYWSYDANASDIDVDEGIDTLTWNINNSMLDINSATGLISDTASDEDEGTYTINVTVSDGTDEDSTTFTYTIIANRAPNVTSINLTPTQPYTTNDLNCSFIANDDRLSQLSVNISWYKDNIVNTNSNISVINGSLTSNILGSGNTTKNEEWNCTIIPYDNNRYGEQISTTVTIQNSLPTAPDINLTPLQPYTNNDLNVVFNQVSQDDDSDTITYAYRWYKDGVLQAGQTTSTVSNGVTSKNELWLVNITPDDGESNGLSSQKNVTILNSAPSITSGSISPTTAYEITTLTASASGWSDLDGEAANYLYQWLNQSIPISGANTSTLNGTYFSKGDAISVNITPYDSDEFGSSILSNNVTILNSLPAISPITISASTSDNVSDDDLQGAFSVSDNDNDIIVSNETAWYKNNVEQTSLVNLTLVDSSNTNPNDEWIFSARAFDGENLSIWYNSSALTIQESPTLPRLISPSNNTYFNDTSVRLTYISPNTEVMNCSIYANESSPPSTTIKTNNNLQPTTTLIFNWQNINDNAYYWLVNCIGSTKDVNSTIKIFTVDTTPPATYPNLTQFGVNDSDLDGNIELNWTADSDANTYNIYRNTTQILDAANMSPIATVSATSWEDTSILNGSVYWYALTTVDAAGNENKSVVSESFNATSIDTLIPRSPTNVSASSFQGTTTISWNKATLDVNGNNDQLGLQYKVWFKINTSTNLSKDLVNETADLITTVTQDSCSGSICSTTHSLSGSTQYYYFITTIDDADNENLTLDNSTNGNTANLTITITPPSDNGGGNGGGGGGGGGGSGGGGGGGGILTQCSEDWSCSEWYSCVSGIQARNCIDVNSCGTEKNKPSETRDCESCKEEWQCGDWTPCVNNKQTRACIDKNDCGTENNPPGKERDCNLDTCSDGIKNYEEVGIDCGGPCRACKAEDFITGKAIKLITPSKPNPFLLIPTIFLLIIFIALKTIKISDVKFKKIVSALHLPMVVSILALLFLSFFGAKITGFIIAGNETIKEGTLNPIENKTEEIPKITGLSFNSELDEKKAKIAPITLLVIIAIVSVVFVFKKKFPDKIQMLKRVNIDKFKLLKRKIGEHKDIVQEPFKNAEFIKEDSKTFVPQSPEKRKETENEKKIEINSGKTEKKLPINIIKSAWINLIQKKFRKDEAIKNTLNEKPMSEGIMKENAFDEKTEETIDNEQDKQKILNQIMEAYKIDQIK